jgi:FdhD protein
METSTHRIRRWRQGGKAQVTSDELAVEEPLEIQVDTRSVSVTMRTPGHDEELAAGFLLSEGLIQHARQIRAIRPHPRNIEGNVVGVFLQPEVRVDFGQLTRHVFASSSCGLCGKATISAVHRRFKPVRTVLKVRALQLMAMARRLRKNQAAFDRTGGLHAAGLFSAGGRLVVLREDVGRQARRERQQRRRR